MGLYQDWVAVADAERATRSEYDAFWNGYFALETENYKKILANHETLYAGKLGELAETFEMDDIVFAGFLDGINTSLKEAIDLEDLSAESEIKLDVDFEKLYYNMHEAKANWLYELPEWDGVLSEDRRKEITKEYRSAKIFVKEETIGRNDPCPCGSGKKYKKCCGAGK